MHRVSQSIVLSVLCSLAANVLRADEGVRLSADRTAQSLQVVSLVDARVFLVIGVAIAPPIRIGIELDVQPQYVLDLGRRVAGEALVLAVPRGLYHLSAEAVAVGGQGLELYDSNVVALADVYTDLIEATFRAQLLVADTAAREYALDASLTAPTSGHEFVFDALQLDQQAMHVYLRLIEPGEGEVTLPVLTDHRRFAQLGRDVGTVVRVYLMRERRGEIGAQVYRLMVELPVDGG